METAKQKRLKLLDEYSQLRALPYYEDDRYMTTRSVSLLTEAYRSLYNFHPVVTFDRLCRLWACSLCREACYHLPGNDRKLIKRAEDMADSGDYNWPKLADVGSHDIHITSLFMHPANRAAYWVAYYANIIYQRKADLMRHIFEPLDIPVLTSPLLKQLAESVYQGDLAVAYVLKDALLDSNQDELAEHFKPHTLCPKGCYVLDVLTGRRRQGELTC